MGDGTHHKRTKFTRTLRRPHDPVRWRLASDSIRFRRSWRAAASRSGRFRSPGRIPAAPSTSSRRMSAWPAWRATSARTWTATRWTVTSPRDPHQGTFAGGAERPREEVEHRCAGVRSELQHLLAGDVREHPQVDVGLLLGVLPHELPAELAPPRQAGVAEDDGAGVLDEAEQVRAGVGHRSPCVVLRQAVDLRQQVVELLREPARQRLALELLVHTPQPTHPTPFRRSRKSWGSRKSWVTTGSHNFSLIAAGEWARGRRWVVSGGRHVAASGRRGPGG